MEAVGGWWNRQNNPEIDLIGANRAGAPSQILFAGSIKWHTTTPFGGGDYFALRRDVASVPGTDETTELIAVSRTGTSDISDPKVFGPEDLIRAWQR